MEKTTATIRMMCLKELGDCFLLTFQTGKKKSNLLIDCGSFRNGADSQGRLKEVLGAIKKLLGRGVSLDVVVATHQHNDHVSGFVHCENEFRKIVEQVWLSWLDDPLDRLAQGFGEEQENLRLKLTNARNALVAGLKGRSLAPQAQLSLGRVDDLLGFFGPRAKPEPRKSAAGKPPVIPALGVKILRDIGKTKPPKYLKPGQTLEIPGQPVGSVKIHVLGPPRDEKLLYRKNPRSGESYDHALAAAGWQAMKFVDALTKEKRTGNPEEADYPFNNRFKIKAKFSPALSKVRARYESKDEAWRKIDDDWLQQAESLALYLDTYTNNSSLVLAIELVESRKVLLFAGDAQTGNWTSWKDVKWEDQTVSTDDLLARTVFYKVGHHASHNATLVETFEKMSNPDLVAFIPVHKKDPNIVKEKGWKMPAKKLFARLKQKTEGRVLQMDGDNPPECDPKKGAKAAWKRVGIEPNITEDFVEIEIS